MRESLLVGALPDWRLPTPADRLALGCSVPGEQIAVLRLGEQHTLAGASWPWRPAEAGFLLIGKAQASWVDIKIHLRSLGRVQHQGSTFWWPWFSAQHMHTALVHLQPDDLTSWFGPLQAYVFLHGDRAVWVKHQDLQLKVQELVWHTAD
ncbi:MAG TPA: hypothetical protein VFV43_05135 [Limnobacter sp.]|nr:hypothetical protein [Limnobacter sp.]